MKILPLLTALLIVLPLYRAAATESVTVFRITNHLEHHLPCAGVEIARSELPEGFVVHAASVISGTAESAIPFQLDDLDGDGKWESLYTQVPIRARGEVLLKVVSGIENKPVSDLPRAFHRVDVRADADPRPRHSKPAWESHLMAYCVYGAAQIDALGKIAPRLSLAFFYDPPAHGQHNFSAEYGQDFLVIGLTMGAHSPFLLDSNQQVLRPWTRDAYVVPSGLNTDSLHQHKVIAAGPLRAVVETTITQWKLPAGEATATIRYTMEGGARHTLVETTYQLSERQGSFQAGAGIRHLPEDLHQIRHPGILAAVSHHVVEAGTMVPLMGRALIYPLSTESRSVDINHGDMGATDNASGYNYGLVSPVTSQLRYAFETVWSLDGSISSAEKWEAHLLRLQAEISTPLTVEKVTARAAAQ